MEVNAHIEYLVAKGQLQRIQAGQGELVKSFGWLTEGDAAGTAVLLGAGRLGTATLTCPSLPLAGLKIAAAFDVDLRQIGLRAGGVEVQDARGLADFVLSSGIKAAILAVPARFAPDALETLVDAGIGRVLSYSPVPRSAGSGLDLREIDGLYVLQESTRFRTN
jgi:NADH/NAD ratio-sensing transcriptional regulator Rex